MHKHGKILVYILNVSHFLVKIINEIRGILAYLIYIVLLFELTRNSFYIIRILF